MGTLGNQPIRNGHDIDLDWEIGRIINAAREHCLSIAQVTAIYHAAALDRANNLAKSNGDIEDENLGGIGGCLDGIASAIDNLAEAQNRLSDHLNSAHGEGTLSAISLSLEMIADAIKEKASQPQGHEAS